MRFEIRASWPSLAEVERRFDERLRARWAHRTGAQRSDVRGAAREIRIEMDLPGVSEDDVSVRVEGHEVVIEERSAETPGPSSRASAQKRRGGFRHRFPIPPEWGDLSHEVTRYEGVLSIRVRARRRDAS